MPYEGLKNLTNCSAALDGGRFFGFDQSVSWARFLLFLFFATFGLRALGQTAFLLMPSTQDLIQLTETFENSDAPLPLHIVYHPHAPERLAFGVAMTDKIRNGIHARLLVETGHAENLFEAKTGNHGYRAGTLFLEKQNNQVVLAVHGRNSHRSTINDPVTDENVRYLLSPNILQAVADLSQLPVTMASKKLDLKIREGNRQKYLAPHPASQWPRISADEQLSDNFEVSNYAPRPRYPRRPNQPTLVEQIIFVRQQSYCQALFL